MKRLLTLFVCCCIINTVFAQTNARTQTIKIPSENLKDTVTIQVRLPKSYHKNKQLYPTLYLLDGQWFFAHGVSAQIAYTERWDKTDTPEFIVVGINTPAKKRFRWTLGNVTGFLDFIEKEMFLVMNKNFRVSPERMLFGWEGTGGFLIQALTQRPELFAAYLAASPTPVYGQYFTMYKKKFDQLEASLGQTQKLHNKFLYIGKAENDYPAHYGIANLVKLLKEKAPKGFRWEYNNLKGVSHPMTAYHTIFKGIEAYFEYYTKLSYQSVARFEALGGVNYIKEYYRHRAKKYGFDSQKALYATWRDITLVAITENNYKVFNQLFETFAKDGLLEHNYLPHLNAYAQFYLKHNKLEKAREIAEFMIKKFAKRPASYNAMGDVYRALKKTAKAKVYYAKAVEIARKRKDWRLSEYEKDLKGLIEKKQK